MVVDECLKRLATDPVDDRVSPGDLALGLTEEEREQVTSEEFFRDEERKFLNQAVPVSATLVRPDETAVMVLDLAARPDAVDTLRRLAFDIPQDGADTQTWWRAYAGFDCTLIRLEITWFEPAHCQVAVVWDADRDHDLLLHLAASAHIDVSGTDPREHPGTTVINMAHVPIDGNALTALLREGAARRT